MTVLIATAAVALTAAALAVSAVWAAERIRGGPQRRHRDGEPLSDEEKAALRRIERGYWRTAREPERSP